MPFNQPTNDVLLYNIITPIANLDEEPIWLLFLSKYH